MSTRKITITDATEILRTMTVKDEYVQIQATGSEVIHEGHYPRNLYDFNGTEFTHKANVETPHLFVTSERNIISVIIKQLEQQGLSLPMHDHQMTSKSAAKRLVDQAAGRARFRLVSPGTLIAQEYVLAELEIKAWRDNGSPANAIPICISDWIVEAGMTPEQAAQDLENQAGAFKAIIFQIRNLRLKGKALIDSTTDFKPVAIDYIAQLDSILN